MTSSFAWGVSLLAAPHWWQSPAFGSMVLPLPVWGVVLVVASFGMGMRQQTARLLGLTIYTLFAVVGSVSILWFTLVDDGVSAFGSAVAWGGLTLAGILSLRKDH